MRPRLKAAIWRGHTTGKWWVDTCHRLAYTSHPEICARVPEDAASTRSAEFPTYAEALAHALEQVGLTPKEQS